MKKENVIQFLLFLLVCVGILYSYTSADSYSFDKTKIKTEKEIATMLRSFDEIVENDNFNLRDLNSEEFEEINKDLPFDLFIYEKDKLVFWNSNNAIPEVDIDLITKDVHLVSLKKNGYYIAVKRIKDDRTYVGLNLLRKSYSLVNNYLSNNFSEPFDFLDSDIILPALHSSGKAILSPKGEVLFKIQRKENPESQIDKTKLFLSVLGFIALFFFLFRLVLVLDKKNEIWSLVGTIIFSFLFFNIMSLVPFEFKKSIYFKPELYGNTEFSSLGSLLLIVLCLVCVYYHLAIVVLKRKTLIPKFFKYVFYILSVRIFVWSSFVLKSLILDTVINFGIKNLAVFNTYSAVILLLSFFISLIPLLNIIIVVFLIKNDRFKEFILVLLSLLVFLLSLYYKLSMVSAYLTILYIVFLAILIFIKQLFNKSNSFLLATLSIVFMVMQVSIVFISYSVDKNENRKEALAFKKVRQRDLTAEDLFTKVEKKIIEDAFVIEYLKDPLSTYSDLYKRLDTKYFGGYFSKFDIKLVAFNKDGKPLKNVNEQDLQFYINKFSEKGEATLSKNLFLIRAEHKQASYSAILKVEENDNVIGRLMFEIVPKSNEIGNVYPELLLHKESNFIDQFEYEFDEAIYYNNLLISKNKDIEYPLDFEKLESAYNDLDHFVLETEQGIKKIVVSSKKNNFSNNLSLFSFIMSSFFLLGFVIIVVYSVFSNFQDKSVFIYTFRKKITLAIILLGMFSFLVIGIVTIGYFSNQYQSYHKKRLVRKEKAILTSLEFMMIKNDINSEKDLKLFYQNFQNTDLKKISEIHKMDLNIYGLNGYLITSSQKDIFSNGLISNIMNPTAYIALFKDFKNLILQEEKIGKLSYTSVYVPIRNKDNDIISFLNVPYFSKEKNLKKDISNFIISFLNVYILLFFFGTFISFFVSNSITKPLKIISDKLGQLSLSNKNTPIAWQSDDEIGILVKEYNKMIVELEHSANLLAKNERDEAWREMAKQIAHEIKNPLTPMKLSIQFLQRALKEDPEKAVGLAEKVSKTLIEQIDNLTDIATAFSSFAKMPIANKEEVCLIDVLDAVIDLFNRENDKIISKNYDVLKPIIFADQNQMISVFNNLVKNALQATEEKNNPQIEVRILEKEKTYLVSVKDNGVGISENKKHKVFVPNFTTKSSGSGLGLAISKQIIQNLKGNIWFESIENEYTTFYVEIPIHTLN